MAKRVSDEIDGVGVFTYDTDLLAEAHKLTRPELIDLARPRKYTGISKFRKADLAIIVADTWTEQRDAGAIKPSADEVAEMYERAAAIDEKRTIARAYLCTPSNVVLSWAEIEQGYLDAMAERDRIEHNQAVRAQTERDELIAKGRKLGLTAAQLLRDTDDLRATIERAAAEQQRVDTLIEQLDGSPAEPADEPREIDTWLESGMVLVGPQSGDRYTFLRWDGGTAILRHADLGTEHHVHQADVTTWQYLPKASAEGVAAAKRRVPWRRTFVMHERTGQRYRVLGMDNIVTGKLIISHDCDSKCSEHERAVSPDVLQWDYIACDENGNVQPLPRNSLNRRSAPAYAVGDRVRWSGDRRREQVNPNVPQRGVEALGLSIAAGEDLSPEPRQLDRVPDTREAWKAYADKLKVSRDAAEAKVAELLNERDGARRQVTQLREYAQELLNDKLIAERELGRLRQRLLWMIGHWQTQGRGTTVPIEDLATALRDSR